MAKGKQKSSKKPVKKAAKPAVKKKSALSAASKGKSQKSAKGAPKVAKAAAGKPKAAASGKAQKPIVQSVPKTKGLKGKVAATKQASILTTAPTKGAPKLKVVEKADAKVSIKYCSMPGCKEQSTTEKYCRTHYMMAFQATQIMKRKEVQGKIKELIQNLGEKYPDEYLDLIKSDFSSDESFQEALDDLEIGADVDLGHLPK